MARSRKKLGEILVGWGVITPQQAEQAVQLAKGSGKRLGEAIVEAGFAKQEQVAKALANQFGMEFVDLSAPGMSDKVDMKLIDQELIKKHAILPMSKSGNKMQVVIHDPMNLELLDMLRFRYGVEIEPRLAAESQIRTFIEGGLKSMPKMVSEGESLVTGSIVQIGRAHV